MEVYRLPENISEHGIHLWTIPTPSGQQAQIALEELKAEYNTQFSWTFMGFESREQKKPWYLALNPNGKMPTILDKTQASPVSIMECGGIFTWLAEVHDKERKFGFLGISENSQMIQWLFWSATSVAVTIAQLYYFEHATPERVPIALDIHHKEALRLMGVLDKHLAGVSSGGPEREYVAGSGKGRYSYADMAMFPWLAQHEFFGISKEEVAHLSHFQAWLDRVRARPAVQRGMNNYSKPM